MSIRNAGVKRGESWRQKGVRDFQNADAGAGRTDNQERRGDLRESSYNKGDEAVSSLLVVIASRLVDSIVKLVQNKRNRSNGFHIIFNTWKFCFDYHYVIYTTLCRKCKIDL